MILKLFRTMLFFLLMPLALQSQQLIDGIAALVGEEIILVSDINQMAMELARQNGIDLRYQSELFGQLQNQALEELINVEIILLQAELDSVTVKKRDVAAAVNEQLQQYIQMAGGNEENLVNYMGMSIENLREKLYPRIKSGLLVQQMQTSKFQNISVTRPEVMEFYKEMKDSLPPIPERVEIAHILKSPRASDEKSKDIYRQLDSIRSLIINEKLSFEDAAAEYSEDPGSAERGGDLGMVQRGTFVPEFEKAVYELQIGEISPIIKTQFGYHIIQLMEKRGERLHVRHILLSLETDELDVSATVNKLSTLRENILKDRNFEEMARTESEDPEAVENGGYLGEFPLNSLQIKEFAEVCSKLQPGEISEPFQTEYGVHILKLISRKHSENINLKEHYNVVENMVLNQKRQKFWNEWLMSLRDDFYVERKI